MWKVFTSSNLNPPLKLFFYSPILTNNNLLLKIYCKNIVKILCQYFSIRIFYFIFLPFISVSSIHISFLFFLFSFSCFSPPYKCPAPLLLFLFFHLKNILASHICFTSERERERERAWASIACISTAAPASPLLLVVLPIDRLGSDRLFFFFFLF